MYTTFRLQAKRKLLPPLFGYGGKKNNIGWSNKRAGKRNEERGQVSFCDVKSEEINGTALTWKTIREKEGRR
jgi:hypothetical protein